MFLRLICLSLCIFFCNGLEATERPVKNRNWILGHKARMEAQCQYYFSVYAVFQNEARFLKEWIEYYRMMGAEHFFLVNHESSDNYMEVLQPYIDDGIVELKQQTGVFAQVQYPLVIQMVRYACGKTRWLASIDLDEFIVPRYHDSLVNYLKDYEDYQQIHIPWKMFYTSGVKRIPNDKLMVEVLTGCNEWRPVPHLGKVIVKPHCVIYPNIHSCALYGGADYKTLNTNPGMLLKETEIQINHYWTRDIDYLMNVKRPRRMVKGEKWSPEYTHKLINAQQAEDTLIHRFVPALRRRVFGHE